MIEIMCLILQPDHNCSLCSRLEEFRKKNRKQFPKEFNSPVPSFGSEDAEFLIVGLAPGLKGANFSGRPFTGDYAGDLLYATLLKFGFASGDYKKHAKDGITLKNCRITNAVRCVPPENKPTSEEINICRDFLIREIDMMPNLKIILSLGLISHNSVLKSLDAKLSANKFSHNALHDLGKIKLIDSYHCSRYNTNTGRLTEKMFHAVFKTVKETLNESITL